MPEAFSDHTVYQESTGDWVLLYVAMRPLVEFILPEIIIFFKSSNIAKGTFAKIIIRKKSSISANQALAIYLN